MGVKIFIGVGHETTGATTYTDSDIANLLAWLDSDPANHHAVIDSTSMLGAMPWPDETVRQVLDKCCMFMPFQKGDRRHFRLFRRQPDPGCLGAG